MRRFRGQRRPLFRVSAALAAVVAVPVLAACGGDDETEPTPDFPLRADEACAEIAVDLAEVRSEAGPPASAGDAVQLIELQLPARTDGLEQLQALRPPAELVAPWSEYVSLQEQKIAALEEALGAAQGEQEEAFTDAQAKFERLSDRARTAAEEAGLEDCAELLPPAGQEDVLGAVEELLTSPNAEKVCDKLLSERFVESAFGSVENCSKQRGLPTAASLELLDIGGIAAVWAFVDVEVTDFFGRTEQQRIELVFEGDEDAENGRWLVDFRDRLSVPEEKASTEDDEASADESGEQATDETTTEDTTTEETTGEEELDSP
jgi:hypothetical protein